MIRRREFLRISMGLVMAPTAIKHVGPVSQFRQVVPTEIGDFTIVARFLSTDGTALEPRHLVVCRRAGRIIWPQAGETVFLPSIPLET